MPERRRGIVSRLTLTLALAVFVFATLATLIGFVMAQHAEDLVLANILQARIDGRLETGVFTTVSIEDLQPEIVAAIGRDGGPMEVHLADGEEIMAYRPEPDGLVYLFDVEHLENPTVLGLQFGLALPMIILLGLALIMIPTFFITRRLLRPLGLLVETIASAHPGERLQIDRSLRERHDEVGLLAKALDEMLDRVDGFVERERRFSRDASHELRTPVTVANGAIDLLKRNRHLDGAAERAVQRIARATEDMEALIDAFLLLARETEMEDLREDLALSSLIDDALAGHAMQIERRGLEIEQQGHADPHVSAPPTIARIVLRNLVRNAVTHASGGQVLIERRMEAPQLCISNAADRPGPKPSNRQGFGLTIVEDCCRRLGWRIAVEHGHERFRACITFF